MKVKQFNIWFSYQTQGILDISKKVYFKKTLLFFSIWHVHYTKKKKTCVYAAEQSNCKFIEVILNEYLNFFLQWSQQVNNSKKI